MYGVRYVVFDIKGLRVVFLLSCLTGQSSKGGIIKELFFSFNYNYPFLTSFNSSLEIKKTHHDSKIILLRNTLFIVL